MSILDGLLAAASALGGSNDGSCDWICDECGTYMNDQPGFTVSSGNWTCTECGSVNDVSEDNVLEELDDDYVGSAQYYDDEEKRRRQERDDLFELGIDPDD